MKNNQYIYKSLHFISLAGILSMLFLNSCYKDRLKLDKFSGGEWNPNLAAPLFYGEMDMNYLTKDSKEIWREDADGLLSLVYIGEQITQVGDKVINIDDQQQDTSIVFLLPPGLLPGDSTSKIFLIKPEFETDINERVDSILIKSGTMTIEVTSDINHDSYVELIIPQLTKYGITFKEKINIPNTNGTPTTYTRNISVEDYWLRVNVNGNNDNKIDEFVKVMVKRSMGPDNSPYTITLSQELKNITYYQAFGYFDQYTVDIDETSVGISLFDNGMDFSATMEDATLSLIFRNSYGMPIDVTFNDLYVEKDGLKKDVVSSLLPNISLNYPNLSEVGESDTTMLIFTPSNSNVVDIVNFAPKKLIYSGVSKTNPSSSVTNNFVVDTSSISVTSELEIPLHGRAIVYTLQDTAAVNFEDDFDFDKIISMDLNIITDNYFPVEAELQLYFADTNYVIYDSIFVDKVKIINAGIPGPAPAYRVSSPIHNMATAHLTNQGLQNLKKSRNLIISARASTYDKGQKIIKIYSDYKIKFELSAKAEYKTDY